VKIDKEFLREVTSDETAAAIGSYVINLADEVLPFLQQTLFRPMTGEIPITPV
jgi:hypothetical protein